MNPLLAVLNRAADLGVVLTAPLGGINRQICRFVGLLFWPIRAHARICGETKVRRLYLIAKEEAGRSISSPYLMVHGSCDGGHGVSEAQANHVHFFRVNFS